MSERFYVDSPIHGDLAKLGGTEAHHLIHVMRARPGNLVTLFDGSGAEFVAEVRGLGRSDVELAVRERREIDRELPQALVLGVALPKGDRQKWLVEKAVEVGVARLVPLRTARSVAQPGAEALDRLRRGVIEASKQCGRNRLMQLCPAQDWADFVAGASSSAPRLLAHPQDDRTTMAVEPNQSFADLVSARGEEKREAAAREIFLAVGPEGGFSEDEIAGASSAGWQCVDLGPRILRIETAALVLAALAARAGSTPSANRAPTSPP